MQTIEDIIQKEGFYMTAAQGVSMLPFIRPRVDTVVLQRVTEDCKPMDVVLYHNPAGQLVLHRVIKSMEDCYLICGDNCILFEQIKKTKVIGRLTKVYRGEKEIELNSLAYRIYVCLWCRPCRMRMLFLRIRNRLGRIARKIRHKAV